ncbi:Mitochondrial carrier protein [Aspergillus sclerotialis]|uniref:Mitochondrial carrier protein n=1 Tax=Aspergillus sclerotialis TaxID=2070753 RepID=A0A3A2ZJM2_9EURO|nr:Mitochondrial carrier protein [Aspergillus sclerotialis]
MTTPAEVLKQNAQVVDNASGKTPSGTGNQSEKREDQRHASMKVFSRFKGQPWKLWSGYSALVARNLPSTGLQFPIYEFVRGHVGEWRRQMKGASGGVHGWSAVVERAGVTGFSAAVSGAISAIVTTPIDVVKTRMMLSAGDGKVTAQGGSGESSDGAGDGEKKKKKNPSTLAVGRQIFREEGIKGLFRGGLIRVGWTALSLSMYLTIYEGSRFYLENRRKKKEKTNGDGIYNYT